MLAWLGIGAQKAGTSWLYRHLCRHPALGFPVGKESHFWDKHYRPEAVDHYFAQFGDPRLKEGEITPAYAQIELDRIHALACRAPDLRLLYLIRHPIERAWSAALMALERAQMLPDEASDQWFIDLFRSRASLRRGDYAMALRHWHRYFPPEQLLLSRFERIAQAPAELLRAVAAHLDIDPAPLLDCPDAALRAPVFAGAGIPLRPSLRPMLEALYQPMIAELDAYLGEPTGWLASDNAARSEAGSRHAGTA